MSVHSLNLYTPPLPIPLSPTHIIQKFAFHSKLPGSHLVCCWSSPRGSCSSCVIAVCLAGAECIGNIDPKFSLLLKRKSNGLEMTDVLEALPYLLRSNNPLVVVVLAPLGEGGAALVDY